MRARSRPRLTLALVVAATTIGLMGTDLVLPAIHSLPETLGGDPAEAQLVLAAYAGGTGIGLIAFGALGDRFATRTLFLGSLLLTGLVSLACAAAPGAWPLIGGMPPHRRWGGTRAAAARPAPRSSDWRGCRRSAP